MILLLISLAGFFEVITFLFAIVAFLIAVRFFVDSRKRIEALFPGLLRSYKALPFAVDRDGFILPKSGAKRAVTSQPPYTPEGKTRSSATNDDIKLLRSQMDQQQRELKKALAQIAALDQRGGGTEGPRYPSYSQPLADDPLPDEESDATYDRLHQQEILSDKMQERLEDVQAEFGRLQEKLQQMEKQAWKAAELTVQLEHAEQAQARLEKALQKKEETVRELTLENRELHSLLRETEEKLAATTLQQKQLLKKVEFQEQMNADMQQMLEANQKLKSQLTRVAELESMLEMMQAPGKFRKR